MNILMVASEARPFVKTGGLADVVYSLSKQLASSEEHEVTIFMPFYKSVKNMLPKTKFLKSIPVKMSWRVNNADIFYKKQDGINYFFIGSSQYFDRDRIYGEFDDLERFAFFTLACKEMIEKMKLHPDIVHVHDWHAGMLPCLLKEDKKMKKQLKDSKIFFTIHNPAFQGLIDRYYLGDFYNMNDSIYDNGNVRLKNSFSTLKAGIYYADKITTVSPSHRDELLSEENGMGLNGSLEFRRYDFYGILNGIDYKEFNPSNDNIIPASFNSKNIIEAKAKNKEELFNELHIKDAGKPLYSLVSRLTWQKGMDLVLSACYRLASKGCNLILLGSGEQRFEEELERLRSIYPDTVAIYIGYSDQLAHKIYASSDFFLMPSLFEPCGLGQMIAQRYGTLPLVRATGGLKDSVIGYDGTNEKIANGFSFDIFDTNVINYVCDVTLDIYTNKPELFHRLSLNALKVDNSWKLSSEKYLDLYNQSLRKEN